MAGCEALIVMILLSLSQFFGGFAYAGFYNPNILDLAPPFAGTLFGISNTIGNMNGRDPRTKTNPGPSQTDRSPGLVVHGSLINGFLAPQLAGYIIRDNEYTIDGWSNVWWTCLVLQIIGGSFYAAVASADRQPWADEPMTVKQQMKFELNQFLFRKDSKEEESTDTSN